MTILPFVQPDLHVEDYWRGIVLFGRKVARLAAYQALPALMRRSPERGATQAASPSST
jgi:hypothetical protein